MAATAAAAAAAATANLCFLVDDANAGNTRRVYAARGRKRRRHRIPYTAHAVHGVIDNGAGSSDVVMFGRRFAAATAGGATAVPATAASASDIGASVDGGVGGMHLAIVPVPHKGQWAAECGRSLATADAALSVVHGASIVDDRATRTCWLPPGVHMEDVCYKCMRRAGATHVMGMWKRAPPPGQVAPVRAVRRRGLGGSRSGGPVQPAVLYRPRIGRRARKAG